MVFQSDVSPLATRFLVKVCEADMEGHWNEATECVYLVKKYEHGKALYFYYPFYVIEEIEEEDWNLLVEHAEWIMDKRWTYNLNPDPDRG